MEEEVGPHESVSHPWLVVIVQVLCCPNVGNHTWYEFIVAMVPSHPEAKYFLALISILRFLYSFYPTFLEPYVELYNCIFSSVLNQL